MPLRHCRRCSTLRRRSKSTLSFYTLFFRRPVGKYMLQPCRGLSCMINGAEDVMAYFREKLGVGHLETTDGRALSYEEVECLAACDRAPCMQVNLEFVYDLTPARIDEMLDCDARAEPTTSSRCRRPTTPGRTWKYAKTSKWRPGGSRRGRSASRTRTTPAASATERRDHARPHRQRRRDVLPRHARTRRASIRVRSSPRSTKDEETTMPVTKVLTAGIGEPTCATSTCTANAAVTASGSARSTNCKPVDVLNLARKVRLARPRRRGVSDREEVVVLAATTTPALSRVQLRRSRAGHVQGSHAARGDAASGDRGHAARRLRHRLPPRVHLYPRRVQTRLRDLLRRARAGARGRSTSARTCSAATSISR